MNDADYMHRCLELAARAVGRTAPNPLVGAVIVAGGEIVGEGFHARAGEAHAEVLALRRAGQRARGATLYVNLEPCDHHGRTPPCTEAILTAGIRRVVIGMSDPNPLVLGRGIQRLRAAGLEVEVGVRFDDCRAVNADFVTAMERGRPRVTLKAAATLDGRIATQTGESQWITSPEARAHVHRLRNERDAVLVGAGTALVDDPALTCRLAGGRDPVPVVLDSRLRVPVTARMFAAGARALVYTAVAPPPEHPATVVRVAAGPGGLDLGEVLADLLRRGLHSVLVEGGGQVHRSFLDAGLVDVVLLYLAPAVLGGGPGWVGGPPIPRLADALAFDLHLGSIKTFGPDLLLTLLPRDSGAAPASRA
ncbi:MAG: bifunctional diaminohydroxyphosphoribosylaminopyrimidine deaminase/5-amino-6-(5-phosphoribosylamino)uracil reductase RibD [Pseudomonadota bacterium]